MSFLTHKVFCCKQKTELRLRHVFFPAFFLFILKESLQRITSLSAALGEIITIWRLTEITSNSRPSVITYWHHSAAAATRPSMFRWDEKTARWNPRLAKSAWSWTARWWSSLKARSTSTANREQKLVHMKFKKLPKYFLGGKRGTNSSNAELWYRNKYFIWFCLFVFKDQGTVCQRRRLHRITQLLHHHQIHSGAEGYVEQRWRLYGKSLPYKTFVF